MDGLGDILSRKDFDMPPEVQAIKEYVRRHYGAEVSVSMRAHVIVIAASSAGLIGTLRLNLPLLQAASGTDKRIVLRIGK